MEQREPIIRLEHLVKEFKTSGGTVRALEDINLDIYAGEIFGIIGLSGAGKSTLVRCINYLETPTSGEVIFEGVALSTLDRRGINRARQSMGMIFQQFNLLAQRNVLRNVCFPMELQKTPREQAVARARELLQMVGLADREDAYPAQLSGGQKQRVAIARALATNPKVLLCDEATSALDPNTTKSILQLLKEINRNLGVTVIVITHEMGVIESICDRVAIIDKSHIAEVGAVSDIFSGPKSAIGRQLIMGDTIHAEFGDSRLVAHHLRRTGLQRAGFGQPDLGLQGAGQHHVRGHQGRQRHSPGADDHPAARGRGGGQAGDELSGHSRNTTRGGNEK